MRSIAPRLVNVLHGRGNTYLHLVFWICFMYTPDGHPQVEASKLPGL